MKLVPRCAQDVRNLERERERERERVNLKM
jgi:hypothetical protein